MHNTTVVNVKRSKYDVYIGRAVGAHRRFPQSKWGNPYHIGKDGTREEVIKKYEKYVKATPALFEAIGELRGKVLGCWCKPESCHGDVLARLANKRRG